jgi:hypothetical protein
VQKNFISKENVSKVSGVAMEMLTISPAQALEPLTRCTICTLLPPCKHIPSQIMAEMGMARRAELPRYKNGSMSCPEFVRCGNCSIYNKYGHCSLDHPKNVHNVVAPPLRCATCTIPWPCNHCAYTSDRLELMAAVEEIQTRMSRARQINVPDPPRSLTRHLRVMYMENFIHIIRSLFVHRSLPPLIGCVSRLAGGASRYCREVCHGTEAGTA